MPPARTSLKTRLAPAPGTVRNHPLVQLRRVVYGEVDAVTAEGSLDIVRSISGTLKNKLSPPARRIRRQRPTGGRQRLRLMMVRVTPTGATVSSRAWNTAIGWPTRFGQGESGLRPTQARQRTVATRCPGIPTQHVPTPQPPLEWPAQVQKRSGSTLKSTCETIDQRRHQIRHPLRTPVPGRLGSEPGYRPRCLTSANKRSMSQRI